MEQYPIEIKFMINDIEHVAHARKTITFPELISMGQRVETILNELKDTSIWFSVLFIKANTIIEYFTDIMESGETFELSELIYNSSLYQQLLQTIDERLLTDILNSIDKIAMDIARKSSADRLIDKIISILEKWDNKIDAKKLGRLINKLSNMRLDEKAIISAIMDISDNPGKQHG